jgi:hypothetical protein
MPNWKKLIVSGSSANLNDLTVTTTVTAASFLGDGSGLTNLNTDLLNNQSGTYYLNYNNFSSIPTGLISGSAQIDNLTRYEENISGNTQYTINHGLNEDYPVVQVYDTDKVQVLPGEIKATNSGTVELTFDSNFTGKVVVKK